MMERIKYKERRFHWRARVVHNDPMTNPADGWVVGFYYQDLCDGEIRHFIRNGEMIWEVLPDTVGKFIGYDCVDDEVFEGDILQHGQCLSVLEWSEKDCQYVKHMYGCDTENGIIADAGIAQVKAGEISTYLRKVGNIYDNKKLIGK